MNPPRPRPSTETSKSSIAVSQSLLTFGVPPVALGTAWAAHFALNADLRFSLLVGVTVSIVALAPQLLVSVAFVIQYILISTISVVAGVIHVAVKRDDPAVYFMQLLADVTNSAVSFQTRSVIPTHRQTVNSETATQATQEAPSGPRPELEPLPPAPGGARQEDTPHFWRTVQELAPTQGGRPDIVPQPANGRHARSDSDAPPEAFADQQPTDVSDEVIARWQAGSILATSVNGMSDL